MAMGTALIYDEEMTKHKLLWSFSDCLVEVPERLTVSYEALVRSGLADRCVDIPVREATDAEILLAHSEEYLAAVKKTPHMTTEELLTFSLQYDAAFFHPSSFHCAKLAAGAALQLVDNVMMGRVRNGMALVRPPGHHGQRSAANGFCVFNNVAIAAHYAKRNYGVKRVLIVDWDVHHGQGVQYCFEDDPSVLYFSWHRYEHQKFWPNLVESDYNSVGKEKGAGFTVNIPWNKVGMEDSDYLAAFFHVLLPVAYEFSPDLVFVCAGFDSAIGDPEGHMCATPGVFAHLTHLLMNLAGGKLCAVLEGGYNLTSLPQSLCQTVQTLLGDPAPQPTGLGGPCESALNSIQCVRAAHRPYWSSLKLAADPPASEPSTKRSKVEEKETGEREHGGGEEEEKEKEKEEEKEEVVWPEPAQRPAPPLRTAAVLPDGVACPDGCQRFTSPGAPDPLVLHKLRENILKESDNKDTLTTLCALIALVEKMEKNEVRTGLALVPDVSMATMCVVQHALTSLTKRVLLVCVGDDPQAPTRITEDGKTLLLQITNKEPLGPKSKYYVPVCLKKGCSDAAGFMQAVLGLLLPLAYEYDPGLVLLVQMPGSGVCEKAWLQLTGLLQGLARGHTLALMQEDQKTSVGFTVSSLQGEPAPSHGPLGAPLPEDVEALEKLRHELQADWKLLQTTAPERRDDKN